MSLSLVLIPLSIAVAAASQARQIRPSDVEAGNEVRVESRMRDETLLVAALEDLGAAVSRTGDGVLLAKTPDRALTMRRDAAGLWNACFAGTWTPDGARAFVEDLDRAYGLQVQRAVIRRLEERAPEAGMRITSQSVDDDRVVTLVMEVERA
ncbi:hypothetical protein [Actinomyces dentalis]|jgi:hypothetical protein|uniref:hypothetical protein n=1 Tax=Actinomyces dentalis TaxID=272548 RepID=UPI0003FF68F2|nr:hypothetical protein [Actinomyces dentalis]